MTPEKSVNLDTVNEVELLLGELELVPPSERLDTAIEAIAQVRSADAILQTEGSGRFGWPALIATALAACMLGVLVGQFVSPIEARTEIAKKANQIHESELTPVTFNVNAFNLMHGHSKNAEYADCDSCHQSQWGVFEGWFYGDANFFEIHRFEMEKPLTLANCFACHLIRVDDILPNNKVDVHQLGGGDCRDCHKAGASGFEFDSKG